MVPLAEWLDTLTMCENLVKVRRSGFCYLDSTKFDVARSLAAKVGIDFDDWLNRYFDYDHYT